MLCGLLVLLGGCANDGVSQTFSSPPPYVFNKPTYALALSEGDAAQGDLQGRVERRLRQAGLAPARPGAAPDYMIDLALAVAPKGVAVLAGSDGRAAAIPAPWPPTTRVRVILAVSDGASGALLFRSQTTTRGRGVSQPDTDALVDVALSNLAYRSTSPAP